jgi:hypothetical protein
MSYKGIEIEVTPDDIAKALDPSRTFDPVTYAIIRTYPYVPVIDVGSEYVVIGNAKYYTNDVLYEHLLEWDKYKVFHPHTYRLKRAQDNM